MSADVFAGSTLNLSASLPGSYDEAGWEAVTGFAAVGNIESFDPFGNVHNIELHNPVAHSGTEAIKTNFDPGAASFTLALDYSNAGQAIAEAALASRNSYSVEIITPDNISHFCLGKITEFRPVGGAQGSKKMAVLGIRFTCSSTGVGWVRATP